MTVEEIEGMAIARVADPQGIRSAPLLRELNGAYREMVQEIRDADTEIADNIQTFDLEAGVNTYPVPTDSDSIRRVERFDLSGVGVAEPAAVPCRRVPYAQIDRAFHVGSASYCLTPTGIVLIPRPTLDYVDGLRITTLPVAEDLVDQSQTPRIPKPLHDPLAAMLLRRLLSMQGVQPANASGVGDWLSQQHKFLITYLNPSGREAVTRFGRTSSLYQPRRP